MIYEAMSCASSLWILFLIVLHSHVQCNQLCEFNDKECITQAASRAYKYVMNGIEGLFGPTEELYQEEVKGEITPAFKYTLSNVSLTNMKQCDVTELIVEKPDLTYTFYLWCPHLDLNFNFEGKGTLGTDNFDDKATVEVTLDDYLIIFKGQYDKFISEKDLKPRMLIKRNSIETEIKGTATFRRRNLIRGSSERFERAVEYMSKNNNEIVKFLEYPTMNNFMNQYIDKVNIYLKTYPLNEVLLKE